MRVRVSAPGKTILMGEHAAVYGRPALVAAVDRRTTAEIAARPGAEVALDLPDVGVREVVAWEAIRRETDRCRRAWEAYAERPDPDAFARLRGGDPAHLVKIALGEAAAAVGDDAPPGLALRLVSEIPVGAGFGSSAAAAVAVVEAYLAWRGVRLDLDALHRLTLEVERRQHGLPSGVDNATVLHGGLVWVRREDGVLHVEPLRALSPVLGALRVFHSGAPAESTGAVVAAVRARREADPAGFETTLGRMEAATRALRDELESAAVRPQRFLALVRDFEGCLEAFGVVPAAVRAIVRAVEERGGAAKISGAGALTGRGAGSLLVYHPDPVALSSCAALSGLASLDLRLGAAGVRREEVAPEPSPPTATTANREPS